MVKNMVIINIMKTIKVAARSIIPLRLGACLRPQKKPIIVSGNKIP